MLSPEESLKKFVRISKNAAEALSLIDRGLMRLPEGDQKPDIIIGGNWPPGIRGSRRANCAHCQAWVSLSPESGAACSERFPDVPVLCFNCARAEALRRDAAGAATGSTGA